MQTTTATLTHEDLKKQASARQCPVQRALIYISVFLESVMCGKCLPCPLGFFEAKVILNRFLKGQCEEVDILRLEEITKNISFGALCKKGKDAATYLSECVEHDAFSVHIYGCCSHTECPGYYSYYITPNKCTMCGNCKKVCKYSAIHGETAKEFFTGYEPFEILQKKCSRCGECIKVCPDGAISLRACSKDERFQPRERRTN